MKRNSAKGFTLIELMIVVAIIGILAAIAVPNFMKFQARARQAEAKTNLQAWGTGAKSYFAEYNTWDCGPCGWQVEPGNRYSYNVNGGGTPTGGVSGTIPASAVVSASSCTADASVKGDNLTTPTGNAAANIDSDSACDKWSYDVKTNALTNVKNDVESAT